MSTLFEKGRKKSSRRRGGGDFVWFLSLDRAGRLYFYPERPADPDLELSAEHIRFDDKVWGQVYEDSKKYFPEQEIVGGLPGFRDLIWKLPKKSVRHIWIILPAMTKCCF